MSIYKYEWTDGRILFIKIALVRKSKENLAHDGKNYLQKSVIWFTFSSLTQRYFPLKHV